MACSTSKMSDTNECNIALKYITSISENIIEYRDRGNYRYKGIAEMGLMEVARSLPINIYSKHKPMDIISDFKSDKSAIQNKYIDIEYCNCFDPKYNFRYLLEELKKLNYYKFEYELRPKEIWHMNVVDTIKFINMTQRKHFSQFTLASYEEQKPNKLGRDTIRFKPIEYLWSYMDPFEKIRSTFREKKSELRLYIHYDEYISNPDYYYSFSIFWPDFHGLKKFKTFRQKFLDIYGVNVERKIENLEIIRFSK